MENQAQVIPEHLKRADYTLLLKRLEKTVIQDSENEKCQAVLQKKEIWEKLSRTQALEWAGLAQIAGLVDTALEIYELLVSRSPGLEPAWKEYIELLDILDRKSLLVSVVKRAKKKSAKRTCGYMGKADKYNRNSKVQDRF